MKKLDVAFTIDESYIKQFTVACTSLLENNRRIISNIYLVHDMNNNSILKQSIAYFQSRYNIIINEAILETKVFERFKISHHVSKATYFRLLLAELLPQEIDKILFLDSDIVVDGDLTEIADLNFESVSDHDCSIRSVDASLKRDSSEFFAYAVDHRVCSNIKRLNDCGIKVEKYFNAGVMYINLKKWRDESMSKKLIENSRKYYDSITWWDQDVLNITFQGNWGELDYLYNAFHLKSLAEERYAVIHFTGSSKPWHFMNNHPYKKVYWKYLRMTPYRYFIPEDLTLKNIIIKIMPDKLKNLLKKKAGSN